MAQKPLKGKRILAVDDEFDILEIIAEELEEFEVVLDRASTYEDGVRKLAETHYDAVILDIMGVRGFDLLRIAAAKKIPVVMLTAHSLTPESLKKSIELGARAFLPKDKLGKLAPFIKDVITLRYHQAWKSILSRLGGAFGKSLGPEWRTSEEEFWKKFEKDLEVHESLIVEH